MSQPESTEKNPDDSVVASDKDPLNTSQEPLQPNSDKTSKPPGVLGVFQSVIAAMFGVQSEEKRQQDFESGHAGNYIFVGVVMVVIFVFTLIAVVNAILENAGQ
ncbi:DUF2970 domain-containing protein [Aliikangiella coralliicola]|uniref:DUF2970 domain-containing protein n=1 Tax=Aliikangiella coralliicola TaxID=2592383 RepID=A0A545U786_9GAMM|nr:DUF2970 domain-containing protein [Aliikangiella coralliicola]TQV85332.1 DUF2970 domain-containing protein [Aliikangiella coralliicola]